MKTFLLVLSLVFFSGSALAGESRELAIQHNGRVKTFDTFARETLTIIHGRAHFENKPAVKWLYDAAADPAKVSGWKWIRIDYSLLVEALGFSKESHLFSYDELLPAIGKIEALARSASLKRDADEQPSVLERKAESLYQALSAVKSILNREVFRVLPPVQGASDPTWHSPFDANAPDRSQEFRSLAANHTKNSAEFEKNAALWNRFVGKQTGGRFERLLRLESIYLALHPFAAATVFYFVGFVLLLGRRRAVIGALGATLVAGGFAAHASGLLLRTYILERPPVSNMYESIVWMSWVVVLISIVTAFLRRNLTVLSVGAVVGAVITLYGDLLPMDAGLDVLVPVLRSNYWLSIHVLTIVSSYSFFGLAMGLGHRHLWLHAHRKMSPAEGEHSASLIYRTIQIGLLMLGIGTVLGGVWANESWGRFWGWDPKETWALITFLGYLVLVHLHFARIVKPFAFAVSSIMGFLLVLFTWYGVNFVLGRGLHSYGQGAGGMNWILLYLAGEAAFLIWIYGKVLKRS